MPTGLSTQRFAATRSSLAPHVTDRHRPHSFAWDYEERMTSATVNSVTTTFAYRGDGLRDSRTTGMATTTFTWDIAAGLPVVIDDGARYVYGAGLEAQISGSSTYYYLADGLGSTMKTVDASGNVVNSYTYDVYGKKTSSSGSQANEFDFAGQQTDPTGLQYLRARYMDPETGVFLSREPLAVLPSWTRPHHGYGGANPALVYDPTGLGECDSNPNEPCKGVRSEPCNLSCQATRVVYLFSACNAGQPLCDEWTAFRSPSVPTITVSDVHLFSFWVPPICPGYCVKEVTVWETVTEEWFQWYQSEKDPDAFVMVRHWAKPRRLVARDYTCQGSDSIGPFPETCRQWGRDKVLLSTSTGPQTERKIYGWWWGSAPPPYSAYGR